MGNTGRLGSHGRAGSSGGQGGAGSSGGHSREDSLGGHGRACRQGSHGGAGNSGGHGGVTSIALTMALGLASMAASLETKYKKENLWGKYRPLRPSVGLKNKQKDL